MRHLSARRCARPNERSNPPLKSMSKLLAHEDTVITGFGTASRLFIADRSVEALILHHCLMRVEPDFAITAPQCLVLREREQPAAQSQALASGGAGDIVEEQIVRRGHQYDHGGYHSPFLNDPHHALRHARRIVVEHWARRPA